MVIQYSSEAVDVQPAELGDPEFAAIGRLIRACADIEDLVNLSIADLMLADETCVVVALGQTPISKKVAIGNYLAGVHAGDMPDRYKQCFDSDFKEVFTCRNAVAHGVMVGRWANGKWAFITAKTEDPVPGSAMQTVMSFTTTDLQLYAVMAEKKFAFLEETLGLQGRRQLRHGRSLLPHRKSQPKPQRSAKPKHQRRSSRGKSQRPKKKGR